MSRNHGLRTKVPYKRSFRPSAAQCEQRIIDYWYDLCACQKRGDRTGVGIFTTRLHDMGVFLFRARNRERQAVVA
jgi:hypothetical protein